MTYTRMKGEGSYKIVDWDRFSKFITAQYRRLGLLGFEGDSSPPIPSKHGFARHHWNGIGGQLGFNQLITLYADEKWASLGFNFCDPYDADRNVDVEVDCQNKILRLAGSLDNKHKLSQVLRGIKGTFEIDKGFEIYEYTNGKDVFVIHGRNTTIRDEVFKFLKATGLKPIEWSEAVSKTREGSPYIGEILDVAFNRAQALLALLTPDEFVELKPVFIREDDASHEKGRGEQARPNVLFEAGMAFGRCPERTILVEFGRLRPFSDILGRHTIRLDSSPEKKRDLVSRLRTAGCEIEHKEGDWLNIGNFDLDDS